MIVKPLYKYIRPDGGVTVSTIEPEVEYTPMFRCIADEGKILTDGENFRGMMDIDNYDGWYEVNVSIDDDGTITVLPDEDDATIADYEAALAQLGVE